MALNRTAPMTQELVDVGTQLLLSCKSASVTSVVMCMMHALMSRQYGMRRSDGIYFNHYSITYEYVSMWAGDGVAQNVVAV